MNKKYVFGGILSLFVGLSFAQDAENMVMNPGFEATKASKVKKIKQITATEEWFSPTGVKADIFHKLAKGPAVSIPDNIYGREKTEEDNSAYAGLIMYSYNNREPRTYVSSQLTDKLKKGQRYCVKYHVSLADLSKYAVNNLGAHLSKKPFEIEGKEDIVLKENEILKTASNRIYESTFGFEPVCNIFTAKGGEKFITIGNFSETKATKNKKLKKPKGMRGSQTPRAYYYIDNISVEVLTDENEGKCSCELKKEVVEVERVIYRKQSTNMDDLPVEDQVANSTIYFDYLKSQLEPDAQSDLNVLAKILIDNPSYKLKVIAHSTNEEIKKAEVVDYHGDLAKRRADKVVDYMKNNGLDANRFVQIIQDNKAPASTDKTPLADAKNRRVEFELEK